jgi:hypothetical protein
MFLSVGEGESVVRCFWLGEWVGILIVGDNDIAGYYDLSMVMLVV